jgi:hypothetical protein
MGGDKTLYILGSGFKNNIAFARILNMPDETLTMHLLWRTLAINNCSAYVKSCNSTGISPIQRPFTRARVGILFLSRDSTHPGHTLLQLDAKTGPSNSLTGSEFLDLDFLEMLSTLSKLIFSTSDNSSISQVGVNFPQTAQSVSSNTSGEMSAQKSDVGPNYHKICMTYSDSLGLTFTPLPLGVL